MPGTRADDGQRRLRDPRARHERHRRRRLEPLGRVAGLREPVRERHREAGRVRGGDQLLGARLASVLVLRARRPRHLQRPERAARRLVDLAAAGHQIALPRRLRAAFGRHAHPSSSASMDTFALALIRHRERAALVGYLDHAAKRVLVDARHARAHAQLRLDDQVSLALDLVHDDVRGHVELLRRRSRARQLAGERGREAARRARPRAAPRGSSCPRCPCRCARRSSTRAPRTRRCRALMRPAAAREVPLPDDVRVPLDARH